MSPSEWYNTFDCFNNANLFTACHKINVFTIVKKLLADACINNTVIYY